MSINYDELLYTNLMDDYKSPIEVMYGQIESQIENDILKVAKSVGVNVDREELIKALRYDREQYEKGYDYGYLRGIDEFAEFCKGNLVCRTFGLRPCDIDRFAEEFKGGA